MLNRALLLQILKESLKRFIQDIWIFNDKSVNNIFYTISVNCYILTYLLNYLLTLGTVSCEKVRENGTSGDTPWWPLYFMPPLKSVNFSSKLQTPYKFTIHQMEHATLQKCIDLSNEISLCIKKMTDILRKGLIQS